MFEGIEYGPKDPMFDLKKRADGDTIATKVDLGVGIYRNEDGVYQQPQVLRQAKQELLQNDPGHDYEITTGNKQFLNLAATIMFGPQYKQDSSKIASVQTISGTGAVHLGAMLLAKGGVSPKPDVYVGTPAWGNYKPLFELVGLKVVEYAYYSHSARSVDFANVLKTAQDAPAGSVFVLQGCCHNPSGADLTEAQWDELAAVLKEKGHFPFFDLAYQGLGNGLDEDAYAIRLFARLGFEMLVCQSFSKNFALYGERCGALHAVCQDEKAAARVEDRLRCLIRWEFSSSPAYGSRLVKIVLESDEKHELWKQELAHIRTRLKLLRARLHQELTNLQTPGTWDNIIRETGLFSFLPLKPEHCQALVDQHHIYLPSTGRINISGLNDRNITAVGKAIDKVVRSG